MSKRLIGPIATLGVILFLVVAYGACQYNSLVNTEENVEGAWSEVENQLQRRNDLIPNLVALDKVQGATGAIQGTMQTAQLLDGAIATSLRGFSLAQTEASMSVKPTIMFAGRPSARRICFGSAWYARWANESPSMTSNGGSVLFLFIRE